MVAIYAISVRGNRDNRYGVDRSETRVISLLRHVETREEAEEWVRTENFRSLPGDMQLSRCVNGRDESILVTPERCVPDLEREPVLYPYLRYFVSAPPDIAVLMDRLCADGVRVVRDT